VRLPKSVHLNKPGRVPEMESFDVHGLWFQGDDDYVSVPDDPSLDVTDAITVMAWVVVDDTAVRNTLISRSDGSSYVCPWMDLDADISFGFYDGTWHRVLIRAL